MHTRLACSEPLPLSTVSATLCCILASYVFVGNLIPAPSLLCIGKVGKSCCSTFVCFGLEKRRALSTACSVSKRNATADGTVVAIDTIMDGDCAFLKVHDTAQRGVMHSGKRKNKGYKNK